MRVQKALALAIAGGLLLFPVLPFAPEQDPGEMTVSIDRSGLPAPSLPFSLDEVLSYFREAFGKWPVKADGRRYVFTDRENPDEVVIITVSDLDENLSVTLMTTGDYGVNYLREFFEAPFFREQESEQLYALLDGGSGIRSAVLERFRVLINVSDTDRWFIVVMAFLPRELYGRELTFLRHRFPHCGNQARHLLDHEGQESGASIRHRC